MSENPYESPPIRAELVERPRRLFGTWLVVLLLVVAMLLTVGCISALTFYVLATDIPLGN